MMLSETFQVAAIIEKLPLAWKDFKSYLKHKRKETNIEELVVKVQIEEDKRIVERKRVVSVAKANVVEHLLNMDIKPRKIKAKSEMRSL